MGGGKAVKRRMKNAQTANVSLHKAARGKGTAHMPLPAAPTKDDYTDKMPASLRRMLALKEVADQPAKRRKLQQGPAGQQEAPAPQRTAGRNQTHAGAGQQQQQQQEPQPDGQKQQQKSRQQQQQAMQEAGLAMQQPKTLKQKKKEYLNAKKKKKKGKGQAAADDADMELKSDRVAFGEVVHAPPEVALKSKHWAANRQRQQQQQQQQHKKKRPRPTKQPAEQDAELQEVREEMIQVYRSARPGPSEGLATLKTLKELVKKQQP